MRTLVLTLAGLGALVLVACQSPLDRSALEAAPDRPVGPAPSRPIDVPGQMADGAVRLPNQWFLRPVGKQIVLGDFPVNIAVHPDGKFAAVLHCGYGVNEIVVVDIKTGKIVSRASIDEAFYGIAFSPDGKKLFCSGAGSETVHCFAFADGYLARHKSVKLRSRRRRGIPGGMAVTRDGNTLYVANVWGHRISQVDVPGHRLVGELLLGTNALLRVELDEKQTATEDEAAITKRTEALLDNTRPTEEHPNEMALTRSGSHLFVVNANRNTVSVIDTATGRPIETLVAELQPNSPPGSTPNSLALSPDEKTLFVANANINAVAVFDVSALGKSRSLGFIPVGWYPTSVRVTPDGKHLLVANGKGIMPKANRHGPQPGRDPPGTVAEYIAGLLQGTLSVIDLPKGEKFTEQMKKYTAQAYLCLPRTEPPMAAAGLAGDPIPRRPGDPTPIKYCLYVVKENRTYDQVLGDMPQGNGDPSLCLFPERITPNHHQLAREFVLLDNFYVESEVSADGHEWSLGAYASDFVEKTWPLTYGHNKHKKYPYPAEGNFLIATPAGGYLWDRAREAGLSYRSYGEFVANGKTTNAPGRSRVAALKDHFDPWYWGFDTDYRDVRRAQRFLSELKRFEQEGEMPRLQVVRLPNDHTSGTTTNKLTPTAQVGDNDLAFGMFIEGISRSKFWPQMAIFVVEDDAQNGPDHVDAHRTIAYVISPYTWRGRVDSTMYSTTSMLRTIELVLGLKPMSQFDALARPMFNSFQSSPDLRPYTALPARVDLNEKNLKIAWGSELSRKMDFTREDAVDDLLLNEIIWRSVRGAGQPPPPPQRAAFVFTHAKGDDDD